MHPGRSARNRLRALAALSGIATERVDAVLEEVGLVTAALLIGAAMFRRSDAS